MSTRTFLIASLIVILLCATGCTLFPGEQAQEEHQGRPSALAPIISPDTSPGTSPDTSPDMAAAGLPSDTKELLYRHQALAEQQAILQAKRAQVLNDYNTFDAPIRLGRLDRAKESLLEQQAEVRSRLQHRGLLANNLRYAVPPPNLIVVVVSPEQAAQAQPTLVEPTQPETASPAPDATPEPSAAAASATLTAAAPPSVPTAPAHATAATLTSIQWSADEPGLSVRIATSVPSPRFKTFTLPDPSRIVIDIGAMQRPNPPAQHLATATVPARSIRVGWHPDRSTIRVVIDCDGPMPRHSIVPTPQGITVQLTP